VRASYITSVQWRTTSRYQRINSMSDIQKGDVLVFYGDSATTGHVGIYIGSGCMIDASSSEGRVRKSTTVLRSGGYWAKHFVCAYRVF
jgi:cell wall-associated NlpC family hydrolase